MKLLHKIVDEFDMRKERIKHMGTKTLRRPAKEKNDNFERDIKLDDKRMKNYTLELEKTIFL